MRKQKLKRGISGKRSAMQKINAVLSAMIFIVLLPVFFTILFQKLQLEDVIGKGKKSGLEEEAELVGIVAKEIGIRYSRECMKAQCVIARTNLWSARQSGTAEPEALTTGEMQELWGDEYISCYEMIQELLEETAGETLKYNGKYIYAAYHSISAGNTRNMKELYLDSDMPYLTSVACHGDTAAADYLSVNCWSTADFLELCRVKLGTEETLTINGINVTERDSEGYVLKIQVGQTVYDGEEFRKQLGLQSAHFSMTELDGTVRVVTMGLGHGFGLSQYTAELMAKEGKSYTEILQYFYPGAEITE